MTFTQLSFFDSDTPAPLKQRQGTRHQAIKTSSTSPKDEQILGRRPFTVPSGKLVDPADTEWVTFARSWDNLPRDTWMADGGTYRRRRYAAFQTAGNKCTRLSHRPHYQDRNHNPLNGGVERWFAPMAKEQTGTVLFQNLVLDTAALIARTCAHDTHPWTVEAHQFRIEALSGNPGLPTPEGMHHDGRDWVLILLVGGGNYVGGESRVEDTSGTCVLQHRLIQPGEGLLLADPVVRHGTTPIEATIPGAPAWRDTLVLTFLRA